MKLLPSGGSVWSLIENQDMSATTDRIDVGGMWSDVPALFSARGGTSWTQNEYRLNGMSVTDPYEGGLPFFVPDLYGLRTVRLENAGHPAGTLSPGGTLDLVTQGRRQRFRGLVLGLRRRPASRQLEHNARRSKRRASSKPNTIKSSLDLHVDLSGPIVPGKLFFFTSLSALRITRDPAEFAEDDKGAVTTGLLRLRYEAGRSSWSFLWTGQQAKDSAAGAGRKVPFISTLDRKNTANILQVEGTFRLAPGHVLAVGAGFNRADLSSRFQKGASGQAGIDLAGRRLRAFGRRREQARRELLTAFVRGDLSAMTGRMNHRLEYGAEVRRASASTRPELAGDVLLRFLDGVPYEVVRYAAPAEHREILPRRRGLRSGDPDLSQPRRRLARSPCLLHPGPGRNGHIGHRLAPYRAPARLRPSPFPVGADLPQALRRTVLPQPSPFLAGLRESGRAGRTRLRLDRRERRRALRGRRGRRSRAPRGPALRRDRPGPSRGPGPTSFRSGSPTGPRAGFSFSLTGFVRRRPGPGRDPEHGRSVRVLCPARRSRTSATTGSPGHYDDLTFTLFEQDAGTLGRTSPS